MSKDYKPKGYQREGRDESTSYQEKRCITIDLTLPLVFLAGMMYGKMLHNINHHISREECVLEKIITKVEYKTDPEEFRRIFGALPKMIGGS